MRDPHVHKLHYKVGSGVSSITYNDPPSLSFTNGLGNFDLGQGQATVTLERHFSGEDDARSVVEAIFKAWEISVDLTHNPGTIRFTFDRSEIIDRNPEPAGPDIVLRPGSARITITGHAPTIHLAYSRYPDPPTSFVLTVDVEMAYQRWAKYREGKESLQSMAYFVFTILKTRSEGREAAARMFSVAEDVLRKVSYLSSEKGNVLTARKAKSVITSQDLTPLEQRWLDHVIPLLILRLGEHAAGVPLTQITLKTLPDLDTD